MLARAADSTSSPLLDVLTAKTYNDLDSIITAVEAVCGKNPTLDLTAKTSDANTALHYAAMLDSRVCFDMIIWCCEQQSPELFLQLLAEKNNQGKTPFDLLLESKLPLTSLICDLVLYYTSPAICFSEGNIIAWARARQDQRLLTSIYHQLYRTGDGQSLLVKMNGDELVPKPIWEITWKKENKNASTLLFTALKTPGITLEQIQLLLEQGAVYDTQDADGNTIFHLWVKNLGTDKLLELLQLIARIKNPHVYMDLAIFGRKNKAQQTVYDLLTPAQLNLLVMHELALSFEGGNILHWAATKDKKVFSAVWQGFTHRLGFDLAIKKLNQFNPAARTPLLIAAETNNPSTSMEERIQLIRYILEEGSDPFATTLFNLDAPKTNGLHLALENGSENIAIKIFHAALKECDRDIEHPRFKALLTDKNAANETCLDVAKRKKAYNFLLEVDTFAMNYVPFTDECDFLQWLLANDLSFAEAYWFSRSDEQRRACMALQNTAKGTLLTQLITQAGEWLRSDLAPEDKRKCLKKVEELLKQFIAYGANPDLSNAEGKTPLYLALESDPRYFASDLNLKTLADAILTSIPEKNAVNLVCPPKQMPLVHLAASSSYTNLFRRLQKNGKCDSINQRVVNKEGKTVTPLDLAYGECFDVILEMGGESHENNSGLLGLAIIDQNRKKRIEILCRRGVDPHQQALSGIPRSRMTTFSHALERGYTDYIPLLLLGKDYDPTKTYAYTPFSLLTCLLEQYDANKSSPDAEKYCPAIKQALRLNDPILTKFLYGLCWIGLAVGLLAIGYAASVFITQGATLALLPALPQALTAITITLNSIFLALGIVIGAASAHGIYQQNKKVSIIRQAEAILEQHAEPTPRHQPMK